MQMVFRTNAPINDDGGARCASDKSIIYTRQVTFLTYICVAVDDGVFRKTPKYNNNTFRSRMSDSSLFLIHTYIYMLYALYNTSWYYIYITIFIYIGLKGL